MDVCGLRNQRREAILSFRKTAKSDSTGSISKFTAENSQNACPWNGIWCTQHTREVVDLIFSQIALEGALFPSLDNLKVLCTLNFFYKKIFDNERIHRSLYSLKRSWKFMTSVLVCYGVLFQKHCLIPLTFNG